MSSNIGQNYPYTRETGAQRAAAVERAATAFDGLGDRIANEATPLDPTGPDELWWVWACPADGAVGRLHVAGYAREQHAVYAVCDNCGRSFLR
ncbi:MAG: hypothetical protein M0Z49_09905 [Chloroflexi bacterium]|nr:hypothetical protein [Chloroflexota bacterium]